MAEINLLRSYPTGKGTRYKRNVTLKKRLELRKFPKEFFDGSRDEGYGGYHYDGRWEPVARDFIKHYYLTQKSKILDIGCGKGFLLYELTKLLPGINIVGIEVSQHCIDNAKEEVKANFFLCDAGNMNFKNKEFDLVISINTIHNLPLEACLKAIKDIEKIGKNKYIQVDAWRNNAERDAFRDWQLTGGFYDSDENWFPLGTSFSIKGWKEFFELAGYTGDYYWTIFEDLKDKQEIEKT